ncbi:MAG: substrate-binding domain-containing protein [Acidimicrobiales bacterium]
MIFLTACHPGKSIAGAGSDTTSDVIEALVAQYNGSSSAAGDKAFNIKPVGSTTVEGDGDCGTITYDASNPPPNGSSAGINALVADTQGCIDFARSSRGRSGSDPAGLDFFAFARDAVTWARFPTTCPGGDADPAGCAPTNLSTTQLRGIYNCDQPGGLPKFTNWSQVGGDNEPIRRYLPQAGSGTLSFFETRILGLTSAQQGVLDDTACTTRPTRVQENSGAAVLAAERAFAIVPYSFAQHTAQANGAVPDLRAGAQLGSINGVAPTATTISNGSFLGVRYVYNVTKQGSPAFARTLNFVGVRPAADGGNGFICSDNANVQAAISRFGFVPLALAPAGAGLPNSRCRKNPVPL